MLWYNVICKIVLVQLNYFIKYIKYIVSYCSFYDLKCYFLFIDVDMY